MTGGPSLSGFDMLQQGWTGWRNGVLSWYGNPCFLCALGFGWFRWRKSALVASVLACILGLTSFLAAAVARGTGLGVPDFSYRAGFYWWLAALGLALAGSIAASGPKSGSKHSKLAGESQFRD